MYCKSLVSHDFLQIWLSMKTLYSLFPNSYFIFSKFRCILSFNIFFNDVLYYCSASHRARWRTICHMKGVLSILTHYLSFLSCLVLCLPHVLSLPRALHSPCKTVSALITFTKSWKGINASGLEPEPFDN